MAKIRFYLSIEIGLFLSQRAQLLIDLVPLLVGERALRLLVHLANGFVHTIQTTPLVLLPQRLLVLFVKIGVVVEHAIGRGRYHPDRTAHVTHQIVDETRALDHLVLVRRRIELVGLDRMRERDE